MEKLNDQKPRGSLPGAPIRETFTSDDAFEEALGFWRSRVGRILAMVELNERRKLEKQKKCMLTSSQSYSEELTLSPIEAVTGTHDLVIRSFLKSAKDAAEPHVRYRLVIDQEGLQSLHGYLGRYLHAIPGETAGDS